MVPVNAAVGAASARLSDRSLALGSLGACAACLAALAAAGASSAPVYFGAGVSLLTATVVLEGVATSLMRRALSCAVVGCVGPGCWAGPRGCWVAGGGEVLCARLLAGACSGALPAQGTPTDPWLPLGPRLAPARSKCIWQGFAQGVLNAGELHCAVTCPAGPGASSSCGVTRLCPPLPPPHPHPTPPPPTTTTTLTPSTSPRAPQAC